MDKKKDAGNSTNSKTQLVIVFLIGFLLGLLIGPMFMGDNGVNSIDSRAPDYGPGIVPMNYVLGRADRIMFSRKKCNRTEDLYCPAKGRVMKKL